MNFSFLFSDEFARLFAGLCYCVINKEYIHRGTASILSQLCSNVTTVCFPIYFFCTPNYSYTPLNHFFQEYVYIHLLLFGLVPLAQGKIIGGL